jgi:hypothetical protein
VAAEQNVVDFLLRAKDEASAVIEKIAADANKASAAFSQAQRIQAEAAKAAAKQKVGAERQAQFAIRALIARGDPLKELQLNLAKEIELYKRTASQIVGQEQEKQAALQAIRKRYLAQKKALLESSAKDEVASGVVGGAAVRSGGAPQGLGIQGLKKFSEPMEGARMALGALGATTNTAVGQLSFLGQAFLNVGAKAGIWGAALVSAGAALTYIISEAKKAKEAEVQLAAMHQAFGTTRNEVDAASQVFKTFGADLERGTVQQLVAAGREAGLTTGQILGIADAAQRTARITGAGWADAFRTELQKVAADANKAKKAFDDLVSARAREKKVKFEGETNVIGGDAIKEADERVRLAETSVRLRQKEYEAAKAARDSIGAIIGASRAKDEAEKELVAAKAARAELEQRVREEKGKDLDAEAEEARIAEMLEAALAAQRRGEELAAAVARSREQLASKLAELSKKAISSDQQTALAQELESDLAALEQAKKNFPAKREEIEVLQTQLVEQYQQKRAALGAAEIEAESKRANERLKSKRLEAAEQQRELAAISRLNYEKQELIIEGGRRQNESAQEAYDRKLKLLKLHLAQERELVAQQELNREISAQQAALARENINLKEANATRDLMYEKLNDENQAIATGFQIGTNILQGIAAATKGSEGKNSVKQFLQAFGAILQFVPGYGSAAGTLLSTVGSFLHEGGSLEYAHTGKTRFGRRMPGEVDIVRTLSTESILSPRGTANIGGRQAVDRLNKGFPLHGNGISFGDISIVIEGSSIENRDRRQREIGREVRRAVIEGVDAASRRLRRAMGTNF